MNGADEPASRKKGASQSLKTQRQCILSMSETTQAALGKTSPHSAKGLVNEAEQYPWSSHQVYLGKEVLPWLTTDWVFSHFSRQRAACLRQYIKFIGEGIGESHRKDFHRGSGDARILGDDDFIENVLALTDARPIKPPPLLKIIDVVCSICEVKEEDIAKPGRQRKIAEARGILPGCQKTLEVQPCQQLHVNLIVIYQP